VEPIKIDGSFGEGGGQILRTSLSLSMITQTPIHIVNIRSGRKKPGLMRQHLTCVKAATRISNASAEGAGLGSQELVFEPQEIQSGHYSFNTEGAGSTSLVFQTVFPALMLQDRPSEVEFRGGTHNPMAPPFDYLEDCFLPLVSKLGFHADLQMVSPGFYPAGGGYFRASIQSRTELESPFDFEPDDSVGVLGARIYHANLPDHIAQREARQIQNLLKCNEVEIRECSGPGPGNVVVIVVKTRIGKEIFFGFARRGLKAEELVRKVVNETRDFLNCKVSVGEHLADQLLLPLALCGQNGGFETVSPSMHTLTNIEVIQKFLPVKFAITKMENGQTRIDCKKERE